MLALIYSNIMNPHNNNFSAIFNSFVMSSKAYQSKQSNTYVNTSDNTIKTNYDNPLQLDDVRIENCSQSEALTDAKSDSNIEKNLLQEELHVVEEESSSDSSECSIEYIQNFLAENSNDEESVSEDRNFGSQLNEAFDYLYFAVLQEKGKNRKIKFSIDIDRIEFSNQLSGELDIYQSDLALFDKTVAMVEEKLICSSQELVEIELANGRKLVASTLTLCKYPESKLAKTIIKSFNSNNNEENSKISNITKQNISDNNIRSLKHVVIRREPTIFELLISFLRNDNLPYFKDYNQECLLIEEAIYWGIPINDKIRLSKLILNMGLARSNIFQFDPQWCASTLKLVFKHQYNVIEKHEGQHGIAFSKLKLDEVNDYIQYRVQIKIPSTTNSHLFIGLVDKSKYKAEYLSKSYFIYHKASSYWKDSPSSYYWDVWNGKLIKTNERGNQVGSMSGYGCLCEPEFNTSVGIKYNFKQKTIVFYKNGINQGIAFRNVPSGLTPSIDIWFVYGSVEIEHICSPIPKCCL